MSSTLAHSFLDRPLRIGTRGSPLALTQAHLVADALTQAHPGAPAAEIVAIQTSGDRIANLSLADLGGKGLFAKEIEAALLANEIDCAVHSAKDLETDLPAGLTITAVLPREDPRDALISPVARTIGDLPEKARVGTASVRRTALIRAMRPDLEIALIRGNIGTRLAKVAGGEFDATLLAMAGLIRADCVGDAAPLDVDAFLPAAGQGIVAIECRQDDAGAAGWLAPIDDPETHAALVAERAVLAVLDGSCRTPIAAYASLSDGALHLRALVADPAGTGIWRAETTGPAADPVTLGQSVGGDLKRSSPASILAA